MYDESLLDVSDIPEYRRQLAYAKPATGYPPGKEPPERPMKYLGKIPDTLLDVSDDPAAREELAYADQETGIDPDAVPEEVVPDEDDGDENALGPGKHQQEEKKELGQAKDNHYVRREGHIPWEIGEEDTRDYIIKNKKKILEEQKRTHPGDRRFSNDEF